MPNKGNVCGRSSALGSIDFSCTLPRCSIAFLKHDRRNLRRDYSPSPSFRHRWTESQLYNIPLSLFKNTLLYVSSRRKLGTERKTSSLYLLFPTILQILGRATLNINRETERRPSHWYRSGSDELCRSPYVMLIVTRGATSPMLNSPHPTH